MSARRVFVAGRPLTLDPTRALGTGGEADIFQIGPGEALKLFKGPDHPDLAGQPALQDAARVRLAEQQTKLPVLLALAAAAPGLPAGVVAPRAVATDRDPASAGARVVGYTMPVVPQAEVLLRLGERAWRDATPLAARAVLEGFGQLHATVAALHARGVVLGDFNDLNVLVAGLPGAVQPHVVDLDSAQFGPFLCREYTERFLDPLLADLQGTRPTLVRPYGPAADWYAFAVMLFRALVLVDPFGGVYQPARARDRVPHAARPLLRLSVFHADVRLPRAAHPIELLPNDALEQFRACFVRDWRGPFPLELLRNATWATCPGCGLEHARARCPRCQVAPPLPATPPTVVVRGAVSATTRLTVRGVGGRLLAAAIQDGQLRTLVWERGRARRESGVEVPLLVGPDGAGPRGAADRLHLAGERTLLAEADLLRVLGPATGPAAGTPTLGPEGSAVADRVAGRGAAAVATNGRHVYWTDGGRLLRDDRFGPVEIGRVLAGQTRLWVSDKFGVGVSRAGGVVLAVVFDAEARGVLEVPLPRSAGQVVGETCVVGASRAWLLTREQRGGRLVQRCVAIARSGAVEGVLDADVDDGSWLGTLRTAAAAGSDLLVVADGDAAGGVARVAVTAGGLAIAATYPDTVPFVDDDCQLLAGPDGLYVVTAREVRHLTLRTG